ncbi:TPA: hypothetical protein ACH3X2_011103 [Trebouxia sp. C0005]
MSLDKQSEVMRLDITDVTCPLPEQVKLRWGPYKQRQMSKPEGSLEQIQARMAAADKNRQEVLRWVMTRAQTHSVAARSSGNHTTQEKAKKLEAKLAAAEANRQASIDSKRSRASFMLERTTKAADRLAKKQSDVAQKIESSLRAADAHRQARLAAKSAAAQGASGSPDTFLQRRAFMRVWLRRQASSRKLQRMWRAFADRHQTTRQLAVSFIKTGVPNVNLPPSPSATAAASAVTEFNLDERPRTPANTAANTPTATPTGSPIKAGKRPAIAWVGVNTHVTEGADLDPSQQSQDAFESFAKAIQSPATLRSAKALLTRLEAKVLVRSGITDIHPLMKRLFPKTAKAGAPLERYPARVFLCAYMVLSHPKVVFNTQGELEDMLAAAGDTMLTAFELLLEQLAEPMQVTDRCDSGNSVSSGSGPQGLGHLLDAFDKAWAAYLQRFVAWKFADAAALESELIKVAIEMEASVLSKTGGDTSPDTERSEDLQAVIEQVRHDHTLLKERVARLGGPKAAARLEAGLAAARAAALAQGSTTNTPSASPNSSPAKSPASSGSLPASPEAIPRSPMAGSPAAGEVDENEGMAWELLYNLKWQLPTEELEAGWKDATGETSVMKESQASPEDNVAPADVAAHVQRRVKRIAEQAFWDSVQATLAESGSGMSQQQVTGQLAGLLAHMGQELMAVLPEQAKAAREQLAAELDEGRLQEALTAHQGAGVNGIDTTHLLSVLEHTAKLLKDMGSPAREASAVAAHSAIRAELGDALQAGDSPALAAAVVKAVRVLMAQLKMLRMDAANFRLKMLAQTLKDGAGISYAQGKFETAFGVKAETSLEELSTSLTHTRAWLALVSGQVPQLAQHLQPLTDFAADQNRIQAAANAATTSAVPTNLRSGLRASPSATVSTLDSEAQSSAAQLVHPVKAESWRGIVRLGLVHLISGEIPVEKAALAETLRLDAQRLHLAQNDFQQLVVLAACMLLLQQSLASQQQVGSSMPDVVDVKRRLIGILADPSMRLPDLAAELTRLAGCDSDAQSQSAMEAALNRMLMRASGAFKALSSGIGNAIQLQLLASPASSQSDAGLQQGVNSALARCGAGALKFEVSQLAETLSQTAALSEAVHISVYQRLLSDLL